MTVIDAHNHPGWLGHNPPKFLANMDRFGIKEICFPIPSLSGQPH